MHCPACNNVNLRIDVNFSGRVACKFADDDEFELIDRVALDSQWSDESLCECLSCNWVGTVRNAKSAPAQETGADLAGYEQDEIKRVRTGTEMS